MEINSKDWFCLAQDILGSAQCSVNVLNDLLNYDKIEMGKLNLELAVIPIWKIIEATVGEFRLPAAKENLQFEVLYDPVDVVESDVDVEKGSGPTAHVNELPTKILNRLAVGDEVRLRQVLRNLLSNAIKFTPEEGTIRIRTSWLNPTSGDDTKTMHFRLKNGETVELAPCGSLQVQVEDSGAGMSPEQLSQLFSDGIQFNVNDLQAGQGSGLGLYISKGIVEQHSGSLTASSEGLGQGTRFTMAIPLYYFPDTGIQVKPESAYKNGVQPIQLEPQNAALRILIVDDVLSNRKLLGRLLKHHGHDCDQAEHGEKALQMIAEAAGKDEPYDTILLDYEMPVMNGPSAAKEIRARGFDTFIVGITGNMLPDDVVHFRSCGANAVLPKPFKMSELNDLWAEYGRTDCWSAENVMQECVIEGKIN